MKVGTILGVLAAAAAVVAIAMAAPARASETGVIAPSSSACAAHCDRGAKPAAEAGIEPAAWLLMLTGFVGLGAMWRAARPAFAD